MIYPMFPLLCGVKSAKTTVKFVVPSKILQMAESAMEKEVCIQGTQLFGREI